MVSDNLSEQRSNTMNKYNNFFLIRYRYVSNTEVKYLASDKFSNDDNINTNVNDRE